MSKASQSDALMGVIGEGIAGVLERERRLERDLAEYMSTIEKVVRDQERRRQLRGHHDDEYEELVD